MFPIWIPFSRNLPPSMLSFGWDHCNHLDLYYLEQTALQTSNEHHARQNPFLNFTDFLRVHAC
jgi:hypothetical protein